MNSPVINISSTWNLLVKASSHFSKNLGRFFLLSIFPFMGLYLTTYYLIANGVSLIILVIVIPLYILIYGIAMHIAWETMWGVKPSLRTFFQSLLQRMFRFQFTVILFWIASIVLFVLSIGFIFNIHNYLKVIGKSGTSMRLLLLLLSMLSMILCVLYIPYFIGFRASDFIWLVLLMLGLSAFPSTLLLLVPTICLFERCSPLRAFNQSVQLAHEHENHLVPYLRLQLLSISAVLCCASIANYFIKDLLGLSPTTQFQFLIGLLYVMTVPFFLNLKVFYYQDMILRREGYNSLLAIRAGYKLISAYEGNSLFNFSKASK